MKPKLRLGTRGSKLALWQANWVKTALEARWNGLVVELSIIRTTGDKVLDTPLSKMGAEGHGKGLKGLFTRELDEALLDGRIDIAVHSMKDVPGELPAGIGIAAVPEREDPRDAFVSNGVRLAELPAGSVIGTSSLRRQVQLKHQYSHLTLVPLRGNVDTRLRTLEAGEFDGIVLAVAGLKRLGYTARITEVLECDVMVPAIGQGALAVVCRDQDPDTHARVSPLDHSPARTAITAERSLLRALGGSCQVPIGGLAKLQDAHLTIQGVVGSLDGSKLVTRQIQGPQADAATLGARLALELLEGGGREILGGIGIDGTSR